MKDILLIGDSLTQWYFVEGFWGNQLTCWYHDKAYIFNKGQAGYTSGMIKEILPFLLENHQNILFSIILLGTNDCCSSQYFLSPQEYKQNILEIIDYLRKLDPNMVILLTTPPEIDSVKMDITPYAKMIYQIYLERPLLSIIDLYPIISSKDNLYDGVHFNEKGSYKMFQCIQKIITENYPGLLPENI